VTDDLCMIHEASLRALQDDRNRYHEALTQIRDGVFSGNQAAEWAGRALAGDVERNEAPAKGQRPSPTPRSASVARPYEGIERRGALRRCDLYPGCGHDACEDAFAAEMEGLA
jgi:hypothetical protein